MENNKISVFGLFYTSVFKKLLVVFAVYLIACIGVSYLKYSFTDVNEFYMTARDFKNIYRNQMDLSGGKLFIAMFFNSYIQLFNTVFVAVTSYITLSSFYGLTSNANFINRLSTRDRNIKLALAINYVLVLLCALSFMITNYYLMSKLYMLYFDNGFLDKPYIFSVVLGKYIPLVNWWSLAIYVFIFLVTSVVLFARKDYKNTPKEAQIFVSIIMALFISI